MAVALFALSALVTAAALGALLGLAGAAFGAREAVLAAAALALLAAAREAGLVRLSPPQSRRQVPERWRFELPLPVWATGYGAGLGAGFLTYQPVSTFWVACAGALALARPLPGALCFALYGAGRALTLVWPPRRGREATETVERIAARRPALLRANVAGLVACAALLALAPAAEGATVAVGLDPTISGGVLAWERQDRSVVVRPGGGDIVYPDASSPSIDAGRMAYTDADGIRIVRWRTGDEIRRIRGAVSRPSLDWPLIAFRRDDSRARRLIVRNLEEGTSRVVATVRRPNDLGRPALRRGRVAWHVAGRKQSSIMLRKLSTGRRTVVARSRVALLRYPSVSWTRIVWTEERSGRALLQWQKISGGRVRTFGRMRGRNVAYWTTALSRRTAYATRWSLRTGTARIHKYGF